VPDKCYPNTSSGKPVQKGVIAVTLAWYRYMQGLPVYVPNYGFATIEDVGGGLPDRHWIDLGYSDEDWVGWGGWMTIYFLAPAPSNVMWILE
jgi:3D (Asp-Asp-Asp) domain-containing protein